MTPDLSNPTIIKEILSRHGFTFSKKLGQNFLIDPTVCPRIAEAGNAREGYGIIEIGAGMGVLTAELAKRADKVVAIEVDHRLIEVLKVILSITMLLGRLEIYPLLFLVMPSLWKKKSNA